MTPDTATHVTKAPSAVPLEDETMRETLEADNAPKASSLAPTPAPAAPASLDGAPKIATPAPTVPLNVGVGASAPATIPLASSSQPLPKATVQLEQTQQLSQLGVSLSNTAPTIQTVVEEEDGAERENNLEMILVVVAFLLSLFLLFAQFQRAGIWVNAHEDGSYGAIFSSDE